jgi:hypothetical protein
MAKVTIKLNKSGMDQLLKYDCQPAVQEVARQVLNSCGEGYKMDTYVGKTRCNCSIGAETDKAYYSNLKHNTLLKALGGAK